MNKTKNMYTQITVTGLTKTAKLKKTKAIMKQLI